MASNNFDRESTNDSKLISMTMPALIEKKRDCKTLTQHEIDTFIKHLTDNSATPSQIGAMLMAIFLNGLDDVETAHLTRAMTQSGTVLQWQSSPSSSFDCCVVDKHSTGGVGDKISLILAPVLAACGLKVPMVSGRGLAHTGGTIDKLESIPGFNARLSSSQIKQVVERVGCCITGQAKDMAPADGILYAARDVTSTVECNPLITASILSKKAAEGISHLLMDIKFGRGAFVPTLQAAEEQARLLVTTGTSMGMAVTAVYSEMDNPIGRRVGSALEVVDAIECLRGNGTSDLLELVLTQAAILLIGSGKADNISKALVMAAQSIASGRALAKFHDMLVAQNVPPQVAARLCSSTLALTEATDVLPKAPCRHTIRASCSGTLASIDSRILAVALRSLGGGRLSANDDIRHYVGVEILKSIGERVVKDEPLVMLHHGINMHSEEDDELHLTIKSVNEAFEVLEDDDGGKASVSPAGYDDSFLLCNILSSSKQPVHEHQHNNTAAMHVNARKRRRIVKIQTHMQAVAEGVNGFV